MKKFGINLKEKIEKFNLKNLFLPVLALLTFLALPLYKNISEKYLNDTLTDAVVTYATLRGVNAGVSVIKHSSLTFGVGIDGTIAIGEILDPIDDATERVSDMLTISLWALGAEKIIFELSQMKIIYVILAVAILGALFTKQEIFNKLLIALVLIRIFVPFSALFSYYTDKQFFTPQIEKDRKVLNFTKNKQIKIELPSQKTDENFFSSFANGVSKISTSFKEFKESTQFFIKNSSKIINALVDISILYFSKFLLNLILLPWLLVYLLKSWTSTQFTQ